MNVIQPFKRRVILEAVIKAILIGLLVAGLIMVGVAALYVVTYENILVVAIGIPTSIIFGLAAAIPTFFQARKKKLGQLYHRLDGLGLHEGVTTMAEFRNDTSYVAHVQREDTIKKLKKLPPSNLKIKKSKRLISAVAIILIIAMLLFILATPIAAVVAPIVNPQPEAPPPPPPDPTDEIIDDMVEDIDKIIEETPIPEEDKETVKDIVEDMKDKLDKAETNEEKTDIIKDAANDLQFEVEKNEQNKESITESLKNNTAEQNREKENLKDLGEAIESGDRDKINEALDNIYEDIMENDTVESRQESADNYANEIDKALQNTYNDEALKDALKDLSNSLKDPETAPYPDDLKDAIDQAKDDIDNALKESEMNKELFDKIEDARQEILGNTDKTIEDMLDDLRDIVNNSDLSNSDKEELRDMVDNLEQNIDQAKQEGASDSEITGIITETREDIYEFIENAKNENNEIADNLQNPQPEESPGKWYPEDIQQAAGELGEAIKNNDKEAINDALDKMQDHYQQTQEGSAAEKDAIENIRDIISDALNKTEGKNETTDILEDFVGNLNEALDDNDEQGWEDRREDADSAFDQVREDLTQNAESGADKEPTGEWMDDVMGNAQQSIWNGSPYEKPDKPETEKNEDSENGKGENEGNKGENEDATQPPESSEESGGSGMGTIDLDFKVWDPETQSLVPLGQKLTLAALRAEYDKIFERCDILSEEDMASINSYYTTLEAAVRQYRTENGLPLE